MLVGAYKKRVIKMFVKNQYNRIAEKYKESSEKSIFRQYIQVPTFVKLLGDVKDKQVLDLACGYGYFTRLIKKNGAEKVIGADSSSEMINLAKSNGKKGINYFVYDVLNLPELGKFDIVSAVFLLHYSKTKAELAKMCKNIYKNLKKGGKFVALNNNPKSPLNLNRNYGGVVSAEKTLEEGDPLAVSFFRKDERFFSFTEYFWKKETYEKAFKKAGFKEVGWRKPIVSKEGIKRFGKNFWAGFLRSPQITGIVCIK